VHDPRDDLSSLTYLRTVSNTFPTSIHRPGTHFSYFNSRSAERHLPKLSCLLHVEQRVWTNAQWSSKQRRILATCRVAGVIVKLIVQVPQPQPDLMGQRFSPCKERQRQYQPGTLFLAEDMLKSILGFDIV